MARLLIESTLAALDPGDVLAYIRAQGWTIAEKIGDRGVVMARGDDNELIVPTRATVGDFVVRMAELVETLANIEGRAPQSVLAELQDSGSDVVRLRGPRPADGDSIPVDAGVGLITAGRNLILAAACAAVSPRPAFHMRKVTQATEYLQSVRLGQTEPGSFVVRFLSPVDPAFPSQGTLPGMDEEPFSRRVTRTLSESLHALRSAIGRSPTEGMRAFEDAVPRGISANLCGEAAALIEHGQGLEVQIAWARTRPGPAVSKIVFAGVDAAPLRSAATTLQSREPERDQTLSGFVIAAARQPQDFDGTVTLSALVDGSPRRIRMTFAQHDFEAALKAIHEKVPIVVAGDLERAGARLELRYPRLLQLLESDATDEEMEKSEPTPQP